MLGSNTTPRNRTSLGGSYSYRYINVVHCNGRVFLTLFGAVLRIFVRLVFLWRKMHETALVHVNMQQI